MIFLSFLDATLSIKHHHGFSCLTQWDFKVIILKLSAVLKQIVTKMIFKMFFFVCFYFLEKQFFSLFSLLKNAEKYETNSKGNFDW